MKCSGYFLFAAAAVLIACAQQADAGLLDLIDSGLNALENAYRRGRVQSTIRYIKNKCEENEEAGIFPQAAGILKQNFINATNLVANSENIILEGIEKVQKLVLDDPETAKQVLHQTIVDCRTEFLKSGLFYFPSYGMALGLSNEGARGGLSEASKYLQVAGMYLLDAYNIAENVFTNGAVDDDKPTDLLSKFASLVVDSTYTNAYKNIQNSIDAANQGLKDAAQNSTIIAEQGKSQNCEVDSSDSEASDSLQEINEAADGALKNGANPALVNKLRDALKCTIADYVSISADGKNLVKDFRKNAKFDHLAATISFFRKVDDIKKRFQDVNAKIILDFGDIMIRSGKQSLNETAAVFSNLELGNVQLFLGIKTAGDVIINSSRYSSDATEISADAAAQSGLFGKVGAFRGVVKAAQIEFAAL